jgi:hypothetical protein
MQCVSTNQFSHSFRLSQRTRVNARIHTSAESATTEAQEAQEAQARLIRLWGTHFRSPTIDAERRVSAGISGAEG